MKSIMEQASSIMKAIEKAWDRAENPKEFSIKIFETEEKNFFGMTTKPAKIGIFFEDKITTSHEKPTTPAPRASTFAKASADTSTLAPLSHKASSYAEATADKSANKKAIKDTPSFVKTTADKSKDAQVKPQPRTEQSKPKQTSHAQQSQEQPRKTTAAVWSDGMINTTQSWLTKTLSLMGMTSIDFTKEIAGKNLKLTFNKPLIDDIMHEKMLFRSFAHLIMASLRNQYKQEIKDLKVILIRPE